MKANEPNQPIYFLAALPYFLYVKLNKTTCTYVLTVHNCMKQNFRKTSSRSFQQIESRFFGKLFLLLTVSLLKILFMYKIRFYGIYT